MRHHIQTVQSVLMTRLATAPSTWSMLGYTPSQGRVLSTLCDSLAAGEAAHVVVQPGAYWHQAAKFNSSAGNLWVTTTANGTTATITGHLDGAITVREHLDQCIHPDLLVCGNPTPNRLAPVDVVRRSRPPQAPAQPRTWQSDVLRRIPLVQHVVRFTYTADWLDAQTRLDIQVAFPSAPQHDYILRYLGTVQQHELYGVRVDNTQQHQQRATAPDGHPAFAP